MKLLSTLRNLFAECRSSLSRHYIYFIRILWFIRAVYFCFLGTLNSHTFCPAQKVSGAAILSVIQHKAALELPADEIAFDSPQLVCGMSKLPEPSSSSFFRSSRFYPCHLFLIPRDIELSYFLPYIFFIRSAASRVFSLLLNAVSRKKPSPPAPKPAPGVPTT